MKHTPGPWKVYSPEITSGWGICVGANNDILFQLKGRGNKEKKIANAQLIAAAPDLLEALQEALDDWDDTHFNNEFPYRIAWEDKARAAIAKALGQ